MSNNGSKWIRPKRRLWIYTRDDFRCRYCQSGVRLGIDHLTPLNRGGTHRSHNLVTCCHSCNSRKQDKPLGTFLGCVNAARRLRRLIVRETEKLLAAVKS